MLHTHDRYGHRIDEVEFHPAWHALMALGVAHGLHALPWREPTSRARTSPAPRTFYVLGQVEAGPRLPDHDDLRRRARAAHAARRSPRSGSRG